MIAASDHPGVRLAATLAAIDQAERDARRHDHARCDREHHAAAAQHADQIAETGRCLARRLIEEAFPGVSWSMIARAAL